ncbi:MAG: SLC13 family permease [Salegentibacter sp.]|uniref:Di-and tricarboxylate transporter n=1 Tax=Salegentibacter flavus TaxID=287099 RepID=A0A1I5BB47_9FLAO|nr:MULTISPECIES: SLC13 family permease [Salegentibacter]MDR9457285.1 SLC13 family permease [Salegentibacter sp.]SFN71932.1 Di-and tricarboxylate transporter [Salegentibacter flavus]
MTHNIVFGTLILTVGLFAWGRIRHDFVALIALFILIVTGIIDPAQAFSGFGHPAVITVASVLIIGKAFEFSGLIDVLGKWIMKIGDQLLVQILVLSLLVAVASAFMNNVGALAITMPIAIHLARKSGNPPSYILMPIAFASLLGGMTTLIGTPPNIIIATFRAEVIGEPFNMFDFSPVGLTIMLSGLVFIVLIGWRLLPKRIGKKSDENSFDIDDYITEVEVVEDSKVIGKPISELADISDTDVQVFGLVRDNKLIHAPEINYVLLKKDIILLETDADDLKTFIEDTKVKLVGDKKFLKDAEGSDKIMVAEAVVMADSSLIGRTVSDLHFRSRYGINLVAIARREKRIRRRLNKIVFQTGDVLLLQGREQVLNDTIKYMGCLPLAQRSLRIGYQTKILLAMGIFILSVTLVVTRLLPVQVAFSMAAVGMVLSGVLPIKNVYTSVDWPVIVLLGAMIPVGVALETSGGANLIASWVLELGETMPAWAMLTIILVITMFLSDIINNAATVVLMAPIAVGVANGLGYSIDPFLMAVAVGGSCAFLTPIGHQSNTLVMGPGGYKFTDYWRMGLPLEVIIVLVGIPMIMWVWPI